MEKLAVESKLSVEKLIKIARDSSVERLAKLFNIAEKYGDVYTKRFLFNKGYTHEDLLNDKLLAFEFFIDHSFRKGRSNKLSQTYINKILKELYEIQETETSVSLRELIVKVADKAGITKKDRDHLRSLAKFIVPRCKDENIYNYLFRSVEDKGVYSTFNQLKEIKEVADKISSFIIRDVILISRLRLEATDKSINCLFPIDTYIENLFESFGVKLKNRRLPNNIKKILLSDGDSFKLAKISAGLWYMHFYSFDILRTIIIEEEDLTGSFRLNL